MCVCVLCVVLFSLCLNFLCCMLLCLCSRFLFWLCECALMLRDSFVVEMIVLLGCAYFVVLLSFRMLVDACLMCF